MSTAAPPAAAASAVCCDNCGAPVPLVYCGTCGQRVEPPVHSLWHFVTVATEDLTHMLLLSVFYLVSGVLLLALTSVYSAVTLA